MSLWRQCVHVLKEQFNEEEISRWIQPLKSVESDTALSLTAPNSSIASWFIQNCFNKTQHFLNGVTDHQVLLTLRVANTKEADISVVNQSHTAGTTESAINPCLNSEQTFENFVIGKSNRVAGAIGEQVALQGKQQYNPLFLYSDVGLGKTHLLNAIGNRVLQNNPNASVLYLSSERFVKDLIHAIRENLMDKFKSFYRNFDVLLIDDIQFLAGKQRSQEEFLHTFNDVLQKNTQLVMTCDRYPNEINNLDERLKSRFVAGIAQPITRPDFILRVDIVLCKAALCGLAMPQPVAEFIAKNIHSNIREIEGAVRRMQASASVLGRAIDLSLAEETLQDALTNSKTLSITEIQSVVADFYKIERDDLLSACRRKTITFPRHIAMALAKELTEQSLPSIGDAFGGRDHTTVLHACRKIAKMRKEDTNTSRAFDRLKRLLCS